MTELQNKQVALAPMQRMLFDKLFDEYHKLKLSREEAALVLNMSVNKLDSLRNQGLGPTYSKQDTPGGKGAVDYAIEDIVIYHTNGKVKTVEKDTLKRIMS